MTIETARRASLEFVCVFGQDAIDLTDYRRAILLTDHLIVQLT